MELFNHRYVVLRNHIEMLLGILKKCFPILKFGTFHKIWNQVKIQAATPIFHNIIKQHNGDEDWLEDLEDNIDPQNCVDLPNHDDDDDDVVQQLDDVVQLPGNHVEGKNLRDQTAMQMWNNYHNV
jgi:hypothetical protein